MTLRIGVTASRHGLTAPQLSTAIVFLRNKYESGAWLHHGSCIGGDEQLAIIGFALGYKLHSHPPTNESRMSYTANELSEIANKSATYLKRDRDIVDVCDLLLGAPNTFTEEVGSGTWYTVGYARKIKKPYVLTLPNGKLWFPLDEKKSL